MSRTQRPINKRNTEIGRRLISVLKSDFGLTMTRAAEALGYANATTLHKVQQGKALPDPSRLADFARREAVATGRTMNLHWVFTGDGEPMLDPQILGDKKRSKLNVDIINNIMKLDKKEKEALLLLIERRS